MMDEKTDLALLCAKAAHEVNRAYCRSLGDESQPEWADAPEWQKQSAINGARLALKAPETSPEQMHENWMAEKLAAGWQYGVTKDADAKTHPCLVPYAELPPEQRAKDHIFRAVIAATRAAIFNA